MKQICSLHGQTWPTVLAFGHLYTVLAFGGVADGFVPFDVQNSDGKPSEDIITDRASSQSKSAQTNGKGSNSADTQCSDDTSLPNGDEAGSQEVELQLASIVIKAVQVCSLVHLFTCTCRL